MITESYHGNRKLSTHLGSLAGIFHRPHPTPTPFSLHAVTFSRVEWKRLMVIVGFILTDECGIL